MGKKKVLILVAEENGLSINDSPLRQIAAKELVDSTYHGDAYYKAEDKMTEKLNTLVKKYGVEINEDNYNIINTISQENTSVYNSLKLVYESNMTHHFWINFNKPKTEKEIEEVLKNLGYGYYIDDLPEKLDGVFLIYGYIKDNDEHDYDKIIREPSYEYTLKR